MTPAGGNPDPQGRKGSSSRTHWYNRSLGSVSERMLAIILLAALPMAALSTVTAWQSYEAVRDHNVGRARMIRDHFIERGRIQINVATNILHRIADQPDIAANGRCAQTLSFAVGLDLLNGTRLSILDPDGGIICSEASAGLQPSPVLGHVEPRPWGAITIVPAKSKPLSLGIVSQRPATTTSKALLLIAEIETGWWRSGTGEGAPVSSRSLHDAQLWVRFANGEMRPLCENCGWKSPPSAMWPTSANRHRDGIADDGGNYASGTVVDGLDVLVLTSTGASDAQALSAFFLRVIQIVLILGAALLLVVVAANLAIVAPIDELTAAVDRWRRGGMLQRSRIVLMPSELRRLWDAFGAATRTLSEHEADLSEAQVRQALLIKEIHHRVKNNLQIIASLLNLQANRIRQPDSKAEFAAARDRVRALATLHRHLYQEGEPEAMGLRGFIEELCAQLFQAMGERLNGRIRLEIEVPDIELPADQAVPTALIITEAVSNAVKYAFPGGRSGRISVRLTEAAADPADGPAAADADSEQGNVADAGGTGLSGDRLVLVVSDDGIGMTEGRVQTESGVRDGLGIQLIRGFARQLGATLDVVRGPGTTYTINIPRHVTSRGVRL